MMDALKYAHHTLIEKISQKKLLQQQEEAATIGSVSAAASSVTSRNAAAMSSSGGQQQSMSHMPTMSNVNEYCEKFEDTVRQSMPQVRIMLGFLFTLETAILSRPFPLVSCSEYRCNTKE